MGIISQKKYEVHYYEVDYRKRLLITSLVNYLEDIATWQSDELGIGFKFLEKNNVCWVLYKWDIRINKYPVYGDTITIKTNPKSFRRFYAYRKFQIENDKGEIIGEADSVWFFINVEKRKPMRIMKEMFDGYGLTEKDNEEVKIEAIEKMERCDNEKEFNVRYGDIDTNKHVNNVKYLSWALEAVPLDIVDNYALTSIRVVYEKETTYGEVIKASVQIDRQEEDKVVCLHKIVDENGRELTVFRTEWTLSH